MCHHLMDPAQTQRIHELFRLVQGPREPGTYRLSWDGRNEVGQVLSSGLYVYQLLARVPGARTRFEATRKLLMLR